MNHLFLDNLSKISNDKDKLIELMESIDSEKRECRSRLSKISSESKSKDPIKGRERMKVIRRTKERIGYLIKEGDLVRSKLRTHRIKQNTLIKIENGRSSKFLAAFMAAGELALDEEQFNEIEVLAMQLLTNNSVT